MAMHNRSFQTNLILINAMNDNSRPLLLMSYKFYLEEGEA